MTQVYRRRSFIEHYYLPLAEIYPEFKRKYERFIALPSSLAQQVAERPVSDREGCCQGGRVICEARRIWSHLLLSGRLERPPI
jgi:hypothetical protein